MNRRSLRASAAIVSTAALLLTMLMVAPATAGKPAAKPAAKCQVDNRASELQFDDLQAAIDAAAWGDVLQVKGTCVGHFEIGYKLTLIGRVSKDGALPVLDGNHDGRVLTIGKYGEVDVVDFVITNGFEIGGAGIRNEGTLTLHMATSVTSNEAEPFYADIPIYPFHRWTSQAGGIYNAGTLYLYRDASVTNNTAMEIAGIDNSGTLIMEGSDPKVSGNTATAGFAGGIRNQSGAILTMNSAEVSGNAADSAGGIYTAGVVNINYDSVVSGNTVAAAGIGAGIYVGPGGKVTLNHSSSVSGNSAPGAYGRGGGVVVNGGSLTLNDSSTVSWNTALTEGGGIYMRLPGSSYSSSVTLNDSSSVTGNTAAYGGGISWSEGEVFLNNSSSVSGNAALVKGGGLYSSAGLIPYLGEGWSGTVCGNTPDDWEGCSLPI